MRLHNSLSSDDGEPRAYTRRDAILFSANESHGVRRTNEEHAAGGDDAAHQ
jgi:hypothetical protein